MISHRTLSLAVLSASLVLLPACKSPDAPVPVGSVRKLGGAPARILKLVFSGDGQSVFALERRSPEPGDYQPDQKFAITKRPVAGGDAVDVLVTDREIVDFVPFGEGVYYLDRLAFPPSLPVLPGESKDRREARGMLAIARKRAVEQTGLSVAAPGDVPQGITKYGTRCFSVVGAPGGKWVAYSLTRDQFKASSADEAEVSVRGLGPNESYTLTRGGVVHDISHDGSHVLLLRRSSSVEAFDLPLRPVYDVTAFTMVDVKKDSTVPLPGTLQVDGAEVKTDKLAVAFAGDGLVFHSPKGDVYRTALDGSKAVRVAGPLPDAPAGGADAPAGSAAPSSTVSAPAPVASASSTASAGAAPPAGAVRMVDRRGVALEVRQVGAEVEVSRPAVDKEHPSALSARLDGPIEGLGPVAVDPTGTRMAFAVVSDTSRDGVVDPVDDDALVFVSDPAKGSLALDRPQVSSLADELRPKLASALSIPAASVTIVHAGSKLEITADLPWIEGEKAQALTGRMIVAARAMNGVAARKRAVRTLRVGPFELRLVDQQEGAAKPYVALVAPGIVLPDPAALPLVLHDPTLTTIVDGAFDRTLTGTLENTGTAPIGPLTVTATARPEPWESPADAKNRRSVSTTIGVIEPGKRVSYRLKVWPSVEGIEFDTTYLAGTEQITPLNAYGRADTLEWLDKAIAVRAETGAWISHDESPDRRPIRVKLADSHAALSDAARLTMMGRVQKALQKHFDKYHPEHSLHLQFSLPGGGGWMFDGGESAVRYEREEDLPSAR